MVCYDSLLFKLDNIRLGGHTCLDMETFDFIVILCFYFTLEHEKKYFQLTLLKLWII
jgi:hypothetical protein